MTAVSTIGPLTRHELRRALRSWGPRLLFVLIPLWLSWFVKPAFAYALAVTGDPTSAAAWQAVAGMVVMFGAAILLFLGHSVFEDHDTHSDARLHAAGVRRSEVLGSKLSIAGAHELGAAALVLVIGGWVLGAGPVGDVGAFAALSVAWCVVMVALGLTMIGMARSAESFTLMCYAGSLVLVAGAGGLAPYTLLPTWAQTASRVFPSYWYLRGIDDVVVRGASLVDVWPNMVALLAFAAGFAIVGAVAIRLRPLRTG